MLARTARFPIFGLALPRTITIEDYDLTWVFVPSPSQRLQHSIDGVLLQPSTSHEKGVLCQDFPFGTDGCGIKAAFAGSYPAHRLRIALICPHAATPKPSKGVGRNRSRRCSSAFLLLEQCCADKAGSTGFGI